MKVVSFNGTTFFMDYIEYGYLGLFTVSFLAATILPITSEGVLLIFLSLNFDPLICLLIASLGNTLGGITNYGIGRLGKISTLNKLVKNPHRFEKLKVNIQKYGAGTALLSWVPIIGDPLTIALGFFRVPFLPVLLYMAFAKTLRYALIIFFWN